MRIAKRVSFRAAARNLVARRYHAQIRRDPSSLGMTHVQTPLYIAPRVSGSRISDAGDMAGAPANGTGIRAPAATRKRDVIQRIADLSG